MEIKDKKTLIKVIQKLTGQANLLTINRELIKFCENDIYTALFLSQIIYWNDKTEDGWIYKTYAAWFEEIGLNEYALRKSKTWLEKKGLIKTKRKKVYGIPLMHIRLETDKFTELFLNSLDIPKPNSKILNDEDNPENFYEILLSFPNGYKRKKVYDLNDLINRKYPDLLNAFNVYEKHSGENFYIENAARDMASFIIEFSNIEYDVKLKMKLEKLLIKKYKSFQTE